MANRKEEGMKKGGWTTCLYRFLTVRQTALVLTERGGARRVCLTSNIQHLRHMMIWMISDLSAIVERRLFYNQMFFDKLGGHKAMAESGFDGPKISYGLIRAICR